MEDNKLLTALKHMLIDNSHAISSSISNSMLQRIIGTDMAIEQLKADMARNVVDMIGSSIDIEQSYDEARNLHRYTMRYGYYAY